MGNGAGVALLPLASAEPALLIPPTRPWNQNKQTPTATALPVQSTVPMPVTMSLTAAPSATPHVSAVDRTVKRNPRAQSLKQRRRCGQTQRVITVWCSKTYE